MRSLRTLLVAALALLLGPVAALTQIGQQPRGGGQADRAIQGGRLGRRGDIMNQDPGERFSQLTGGQDVWVRTQITDQRLQGFFDMVARSVNVTNGRLTRDQFIQGMQQFQKSGFRRGNFQGGPGGPGGAPQGAAGAGRRGPRRPRGNPDAFVEILFRRFDKNGDGVLNYDEMPEDLRTERDKWDENKDGLIDLNEFKKFFRARSDQIRAELAANAGIQTTPGGDDGALPGLPTTPARVEEEVQKRVVYRAGRLPEELPPWFAQYDTDGDGQIGLYEWKKTRRPLSEFLAMDRNGDGFLTVEEVLRYQADQDKKNGTMTASSGPSPRSSGPPQGRFARPGNGGNQFRQPRDRGQFRQGGNGRRGPRGDGGRVR
jgi:Ca2+-binding EF-hand superfamily protein